MMRAAQAISTPHVDVTVLRPVRDLSQSSLCTTHIIGHATFDSLRWTFRGGFDDFLANVPQRTWATPESQPGWRLVKCNGPREVWRAPVTSQTFYLKYYRDGGVSGVFRRIFRPSACQAEWKGGIYALRSDLAAVEPYGFAAGVRRHSGSYSLLVTQAVEPAYPLNEYWAMIQTDDDARRRRNDSHTLVDLLGELLARAHQAGFEHLDLHAANILIQPLGQRRYRPLFVDLHSARLGVAVSDRAVVRNLAQLNQWFRKNASIGDRLRFLRSYCRWRNEYEQSFPHARPLGLEFDQLVAALAAKADRHAEQLWAQRDRRVMRDGTYFSRIRVPGGWSGMAFKRCKHPTAESRCSRLTLDREWWRNHLGDPMKLFASGRDGLCKDSHSATVARAALNGKEPEINIIAKRPRARNWRRAISMYFAPSRSRRGWRLANALLNRDVAVARPLAMLERRLGPLVLDSVLLTEAIPGAIDLEALLRRQSAAHGFDRNSRTSGDGDTAAPGIRAACRDARLWHLYKVKLCQRLARHVRRLHERGFEHRDCKASNILVLDQPEPRLFWIDMDGLRRVRCARPDRVRAALTRLHVSLFDVPGITRADRCRFLKQFTARFGGRPDEWRGLWLDIEAASRAKLAARERRRQWKLDHYGRV